MAKDELDTVPVTDLATSDDPEIVAFIEYSKSLTVEDPEKVQERILRNLLSAKTAEEVLNAGSVTKGTELLGIPLTIQGIRASNSDFEDGPDLYLHVDANVLGNGDAVTFATGARDVLLKLVRLSQLGMFPCDVVMEQAAKPTEKGFYPTFLRLYRDDEKPFS